MYIVYILKSQNFLKSYVGMTDNLERRLNQHNQGWNTYTKRYLPWIVIYTEKYNTRIEAHEREKYFKSASGRRFLRKEVFKN